MRGKPLSCMRPVRYGPITKTTDVTLRLNSYEKAPLGPSS